MYEYLRMKKEKLEKMELLLSLLKGGKYLINVLYSGNFDVTDVKYTIIFYIQKYDTKHILTCHNGKGYTITNVWCIKCLGSNSYMSMSKIMKRRLHYV